MIFFRTLLGKFSSAAAGDGGLEPWEDGYSITSSTPNGRFAMFVLGPTTWKLLSAEGGLTMEDLRELPERVYGACKKMGLLRQAPRQFFLEFGPLDHPTDAPMCITRTSPVNVAPERGPGETIERAIIIFQHAYRQELAGRSVQARRLYTRISLAHEMAHLFAADEFHGPFNGMGYARLERLTDAIAFHVFDQELQGTTVHERVSFVECFSYITGFIRAALNPTIDGENLVQLAQVVAGEMIREGEMFQGPAHPSETGIALGAPSA